MNQDDFIIHVYCLVCDTFQELCAKLPHRLRRGDFAPQRSDEEVIPIELCGEYFKINTDKDCEVVLRRPHPLAPHLPLVAYLEVGLPLDVSPNPPS